MELLLLRVYQQHVVHCCHSVVLGARDIDSAAGAADARLWYGIQNLIVGAGNLAKAFWGTGSKAERARRYEERRPLRESLSVTDDSPLRNVIVRNNYEHLDERIEKWWTDSPSHNIVNAMVAPRGAIVGFGENETLRWYDPTTGDVIFWGNALNVPTIMREAIRILPNAEAESQKPHFSSNTFGGGQ
ncbi:MAG: hypothetical protein WKF41_01870 [Gaiellaceae bacterium]